MFHSHFTDPIILSINHHLHSTVTEKKKIFMSFLHLSFFIVLFLDLWERLIQEAHMKVVLNLVRQTIVHKHTQYFGLIKYSNVIMNTSMTLEVYFTCRPIEISKKRFLLNNNLCKKIWQVTVCLFKAYLIFSFDIIPNSGAPFRLLCHFSPLAPLVFDAIESHKNSYEY